MDIRTFRASTLQEALEQVRITLGPDAAVLHTREVKLSRLGLFSSRLIEVEASVDYPLANEKSPRDPISRDPAAQKTASQNLAPASAKKITKKKHTANSSFNEISTPSLANTTAEQTDHTAANSASTRDATHSHIRQNNAADGAVATESTNGPQSARSGSSTKNVGANGSGHMTSAMLETLSEILDAGVEPTNAKTLLQAAVQDLDFEHLDDSALLMGRVCQQVHKRLRVALPIEVQPGNQAVIVLVGPTGVGKTTTLAKLATSFQFDHGCEVGLITMDTFRPGAVDQLLQYAETLNAALEVVSSASQFLPALHRLKDCDIICIDTAGRSIADTAEIAVLQELLAAAQPTSVQLVVSATSSTAHLRATIEQFSSLNPTGLVITKLDEAVGFGAWLSVLQDCEVPVSYVTHGQHVPHDISVASRRRLAALLLGSGNHNSTGV